MARTRCVLANSQHNKIDASPQPIPVYDGSAQIATSATKPQAMRCSIPVTDQKPYDRKGKQGVLEYYLDRVEEWTAR